MSNDILTLKEIEELLEETIKKETLPTSSKENNIFDTISEIDSFDNAVENTIKS